MEEVYYHGSSTAGIKTLEPRRSTHGNYVYATNDKSLAIIFAKRCGGNLIYSLFRNGKDEPWSLVERVPRAFETIFNNSGSLYTVDTDTFKDIETGFLEVVSEVPVDTKSEEHIDSVYEVVKELERAGKVKLYTYPNRPKEIPIDDSDLVERIFKQCQRDNKKVNKRDFERLILLHPNLIERVNQILEELKLDVEPFNIEDLINLFERAVIRQVVYPDKEQYIQSIFDSISIVYPELVPILEEKLTISSKAKNEQIALLVDNLARSYPHIPQELLERGKEVYEKDERPFSEIANEIFKIEYMESSVDRIIEQATLDESILLIGPMGTGKTSVADILSELTGYAKISLDNSEQLANIYKGKNMFKHFKDFEFYLTSSVLTSLEGPTIIDFGAGHSVYESSIMFFEMQRLIRKFKNVFLLLPSEDMEESLKVIEERMKSRGVTDLDYVLQTNKHFMECPCNSELATDIIYTYNMTPEEIASNILARVQEKKQEDTINM